MLPSFFTAAVVLGLYSLLQNNVNRIKNYPKTYPLDLLDADPEGEEVFVGREDGTIIRCLVAGIGTPIVLAHGYGISLKEWTIISRYLLAAGYQLILFDQRGHGKSTIGTDGIGSRQMAADYKAVLEYFDVEEGVLAGHSMGGFLMLVFILHYPEIVRDRLKGGLIISSFAGEINRRNLQNRVQIPLLQSGIFPNIVSSDLFGFPFASSLMGQPSDPIMIQVFLNDFLAQDHKKLVPILRAFANESYYHRLDEIRLPITVMVGSKDKTTPPFHTQLLAEGVAGAKLVEVEGKGHLLNWEAPNRIVEEIIALAK